MQLDLIKFIISERASLFNKAGVDPDFTYIMQIAADLQLQAALSRKTKYIAELAGKIGDCVGMRGRKMAPKINDARNGQGKIENIFKSKIKIH